MCILCSFFILYYCNMAGWTWSGWSLILRTLSSFSALTLLVGWPIRPVPDGRRSRGGQGGQVPPQNLERGTLMQIALPRFCQVQKWAFCGLQNTPKSVFGRGSAPDPTGGAHDAPQTPLSAGEGTSLPISHPTRHGPTFGARHASPQKSSQIYAYAPIRPIMCLVGR